MVDGKRLSELEEEVGEGTPVVATYGYNEILKKPFEFLYEFGRYGLEGRGVVYIRGERNMQDSYAFDLKQLRLATEDDLNNLTWGD